MPVRRIYTMDDPILRRKARKVRLFNGARQTLIDDMVETMQIDGVGLAAPQIGVSERIVVVQMPEEHEDPDAGKLFVLVNPEIVSRSEEEEPADEGCLSIPGILGTVSRPTAIRIKAQNPKGRPLKLKAEGYLARIIQHEIDHLDGVLFIDRVEDPATLRRITPEGEVVPIEVPG